MGTPYTRIIPRTRSGSGGGGGGGAGGGGGGGGGGAALQEVGQQQGGLTGDREGPGLVDAELGGQLPAAGTDAGHDAARGDLRQRGEQRRQGARMAQQRAGDGGAEAHTVGGQGAGGEGGADVSVHVVVGPPHVVEAGALGAGGQPAQARHVPVRPQSDPQAHITHRGPSSLKPAKQHPAAYHPSWAKFAGSASPVALLWAELPETRKATPSRISPIVASPSGREMASPADRCRVRCGGGRRDRRCPGWLPS